MINGVVFRRSWRDKALALLPTGEARLSFYESLLNLAFDEVDDAPADAAARIMYEMCKDEVSAEIAKYNRTCERNAANAAARYTKSTTRSHSQPLAASGSDGSESHPNNNNKGNGNSNGNGNLSLAEAETSREREKFDILGIFFRRGSKDPRAESARFWDYYEALGWKNNKGAPICNKNSAAAMWNMDGEPAPDTRLRECWWRHFHAVAGTPWALWMGVAGFRIEGQDAESTIHILCHDMKAVHDIVETQFLTQLRKFVKDAGALSVTYDAAH